MDELFDLPPTEAGAGEPEGRARPRLQRPNRNQITLRPTDLESLLPPDHRARAVWAFVEGLDLGAFHVRIRAVEGHSGRPPIDPAILVALWLYATLEGVGSARALDRLCDEHDAYRWLAGGVGVNYHTLAEFRVAEADLLDGLLTQSVAALLVSGGATLERVAHDGVRVRASAGASSYRSRGGLQKALAEAGAQVKRLRAELDQAPAATSRRQAAARARAAREREERVRRALLDVLPELQAAKRRGGKAPEEARASTTDSDARVMRMGDGGYRPAYNGQYTTDAGSGLVCGVAVTNVGSDRAQLAPLVERLERSFGRRPGELLADGGYVNANDIEALEGSGIAIYVPVERQRRRRGLTAKLKHGSGLDAWRARMATDEGKAVYRQRGATAEWVNALARNRGLQQLRVRGLAKVRSVLLWFALAHNVERLRALGAPTG